MSREAVEVVRRAVDEVNGGRIGSRFEAAVHPKIDFRDELGTLDNRDDLVAYFKSFQEALGGLHVELVEVRDLGDTLLFVVDQHGHGTGSGVDIEQRFTWVMTFRELRLIRWRIYADHDRALEEAGLSE